MPQAVTQAASAPAQEASNGTIHELERLAEMFGAGALNTDEFAVAKARILGQGGRPPHLNRSKRTSLRRAVSRSSPNRTTAWRRPASATTDLRDVTLRSLAPT